MSRVWPSGQDVITAIEEFAGDLVIFGRNNTVMWTDGAGSDIGINPLFLYISDTIPGIGCVSQFALARAKGDLWFLSNAGVQTLSRALQDKTTPINNLSKNVQSSLLAYLATESDKDDLTMIYSPKEDFVLCVFPQANKVIMFDTRGAMEDGSYRATEWSTTLQTCAYFPNDQEIYGSMTGTVGEIMKHIGYSDDGSAYDFSYTSGWLEFGEQNQYLKFVKRLTSFMFIGADANVTFSLWYDFNTNATNIVRSATGNQGAEFDLSEFSNSGAGIGYMNPNAAVLKESEFGGGVSLQRLVVPGKGGGQYIKLGVTLSTSEGNFALQAINLYAKVGRIA